MRKVQLVQVVGPCHLGDRGLGLRAGGVEHQYLNRPEPVGDRGDQLADLVLVSDVGAEGVRGAAAVTDKAGDLARLLIATPAVDRDGQAVSRQPHRDHRAQAP